MKSVVTFMTVSVLMLACGQQHAAERLYSQYQPKVASRLPPPEECDKHRQIAWRIVNAMDRANARSSADIIRLSNRVDTSSPRGQAIYDELVEARVQSNLAEIRILSQNLMDLTGWSREGSSYCQGRLTAQHEPGRCHVIMENPPEELTYFTYGVVEYCLGRSSSQ